MEIVRPQSEEGQCQPGGGHGRRQGKLIGPRAETLEVSAVAPQGKGAM